MDLNSDCNRKMVVNMWFLCVWLHNREETGAEYMPMRPSEKEKSAQSGRKFLTLLFLHLYNALTSLPTLIKSV